MSDKFGKFNKPGEFGDEAKEVVAEENKVEETPTTFGKVRVDEVKEEVKEGGKFMENETYTPPVTEA